MVSVRASRVTRALRAHVRLPLTLRKYFYEKTKNSIDISDNLKSLCMNSADNEAQWNQNSAMENYRSPIGVSHGTTQKRNMMPSRDVWTNSLIQEVSDTPLPSQRWEDQETHTSRAMWNSIDPKGLEEFERYYHEHIGNQDEELALKPEITAVKRKRDCQDTDRESLENGNPRRRINLELTHGCSKISTVVCQQGKLHPETSLYSCDTVDQLESIDKWLIQRDRELCTLKSASLYNDQIVWTDWQCSCTEEQAPERPATPCPVSTLPSLCDMWTT